MPYVFVDEVPEGMELADVVERAEHESLLDSLKTAENMRDDAIQKAEELEKELHEQKRKYAETFLSKPKQNSIPLNNDFVEPEHAPQSFAELFNL